MASTQVNTGGDAKFAASRNIRAITLGQAKSVIHRSLLVQQKMEIRSTVINLEGEAGIGKTQTVYQIAKELGEHLKAPVDVINWKLMSREKEDVGGYPSRSEIEVTTQTPGEEPSVRKVSCFEYVPERLLAEVEQRGNPAILFFDEWPRADKAVCSVMFSAIEDGQLGSFRIPNNWFIIAASNPRDGYQGNGVDSDHAYRRRFCWLATKFDYEEFMAHIKKVEFHPAVVAYCAQHVDHVLDTVARAKGLVYANPAAWEKVSNYVRACEDERLPIFKNAVELSTLGIFCDGLLGKDISKTFVSFSKKFMSEVLPEDILQHYMEGDNREKMLRLIKQGRNDLVAALAEAVFPMIKERQTDLNDPAKLVAHPTDPKVKVVQEAINIGVFLNDLPMDIAAASLDTIGNGITENDHAKVEYLNVFGQHLIKVPEFLEYHRRKKDAVDAMKAETDKATAAAESDDN